MHFLLKKVTSLNINQKPNFHHKFTNLYHLIINKPFLHPIGYFYLPVNICLKQILCALISCPLLKACSLRRILGYKHFKKKTNPKKPKKNTKKERELIAIRLAGAMHLFISQQRISWFVFPVILLVDLTLKKGRKTFT